MQQLVPRVILAGTNSGCGKTTVSCALMQAFVNRGYRVGAFKCGPDYIDPMFHSKIIGAKSTNLDTFFFDDNTVNYLLAKNGADRDVSVLEGVMGYYDGMGLVSTEASTYALASVTHSPVILVVNARGASLSILAVVSGFLDFMPDSGICGVIFNACSPSVYAALSEEVTARFSGRVRPLGYLPKLADCSLESRHLGLVTADEVENLRQKLQTLAVQAEKSLKLDEILELSRGASPVSCQEITFSRKEPVRIAVAQDKAFCFYYRDSLDVLTQMGAQLIPFSPISEEGLPENIQGLYLGGGYPELYAKALSENRTMRLSVKKALEQELPCIAECGGFMYLTDAIGEYPMVGFLPGVCYDTGKLTRFGYVRLQANRDTMLCPQGESIPAHEFHHWDVAAPGDSFTAAKATGKSWQCVHGSKTLYAGYPHFHFYANPGFAQRFYEACIKEKHRHV